MVTVNRMIDERTPRENRQLTDIARTRHVRRGAGRTTLPHSHIAHRRSDTASCMHRMLLSSHWFGAPLRPPSLPSQRGTTLTLQAICSLGREVSDDKTVVVHLARWPRKPFNYSSSKVRFTRLGTTVPSSAKYKCAHDQFGTGGHTSIWHRTLEKRFLVSRDDMRTSGTHLGQI